MRPGARVIGNGLHLYADNPPDHGLALLPDVDGFCFEHFLAFENLDKTTGVVLPDNYALTIAVIRNATAAGKVVVVKAWPGPACSPLGALGPTWCGSETPPDTFAGRAANASALLERALAGFLILATELTYFSYTWGYTELDGGVPCASPGACSMPEEWYPEFAQPLGAPLADYAFEAVGAVYTREYEHASVRFVASDVAASSITWHPPSATASTSVSASESVSAASTASPVLSADALAASSSIEVSPACSPGVTVAVSSAVSGSSTAVAASDSGSSVLSVPTAGVAGISVAVLAVIAAAAAVYVFTARRRKRPSRSGAVSSWRANTKKRPIDASHSATAALHITRSPLRAEMVPLAAQPRAFAAGHAV